MGVIEVNYPQLLLPKVELAKDLPHSLLHTHLRVTSGTLCPACSPPSQVSHHTALHPASPDVLHLTALPSIWHATSSAQKPSLHSELPALNSLRAGQSYNDAAPGTLAVLGASPETQYLLSSSMHSCEGNEVLPSRLESLK